MNITFFASLSPLIRQCQAGDPRALEELVTTHWPGVQWLALSLLDDPAEADDAAQDSLIRAIASLPTFRGDSAFTTWLYAITLNVCRSRLRQRRSRERFTRLLALFGAGQPTPQTEDLALDNAAEANIARAIQTLNYPLREAIVLRYYHELPIADIARIAGVSELTIHTRLSAAHARLKVLLKDQVNFP